MTWAATKALGTSESRLVPAGKGKHGDDPSRRRRPWWEFAWRRSWKEKQAPFKTSQSPTKQVFWPSDLLPAMCPASTDSRVRLRHQDREIHHDNRHESEHDIRSCQGSPVCSRKPIAEQSSNLPAPAATWRLSSSTPRGASYSILALALFDLCFASFCFRIGTFYLGPRSASATRSMVSALAAKPAPLKCPGLRRSSKAC